MKKPFASVMAGAASGIITYYASVCALAFTSAIAMPSGVPLVVWKTVVVFGLGVFLVALAIHAVALFASSAKPVIAFLAFLVAAIGMLAMGGTFLMATNVIVSWVLGALLASIAAGRFRPGSSPRDFPSTSPT